MSKTKWILLRGLGRESGHWGPFVDNFRSRFSGDDVLAVDYPGVGEREKEKAPLSIAKLAEGVVKGVPDWDPKRTVVVGHSLGGMVGLTLGAHYSDLKGLVLINTSASGVNRLHERMEIPSAVEMVQIFATTNPRQREEKILQMVSREPERHGQILQRWVKLAETRPIHRQVIIKQLWAASRFRLPVLATDKRTLLLVSLGDKLVNPGCSKALAERLKVNARFHPWAGHELSLDDPDWVLTEVERWRSGSLPTS